MVQAETKIPTLIEKEIANALTVFLNKEVRYNPEDKSYNFSSDKYENSDIATLDDQLKILSLDPSFTFEDAIENKNKLFKFFVGMNLPTDKQDIIPKNSEEKIRNMRWPMDPTYSVSHFVFPEPLLVKKINIMTISTHQIIEDEDGVKSRKLEECSIYFREQTIDMLKPIIEKAIKNGIDVKTEIILKAIKNIEAEAKSEIEKWKEVAEQSGIKLEGERKSFALTAKLEKEKRPSWLRANSLQ